MSDNPSYLVLARKYRPQNFDDLIGQEAMVRTLSNAFSSGRIAHAFMLTGVRGIGKTTTARIIAKGLNCIGADGQNTKPTTQPCGVCAPCKSITDGRNIDVLELDAASNTQVDKMREILAGVPYRPTDVRYKVYIFDEVHMLSTAAFNAILKTLEEPPEHVKFVFATTEIRKVPVTVLSRCQRFDLRRVEPEVLQDYLAKIADKEDAAIQPDALKLITRAAEGSVRDALSLLDQAIAMGEGETRASDVRAMMGLANQTRVLDLFEKIMGGELTDALNILRELYQDGADPATILRELAEITHSVSLFCVSDQIEDDEAAPDDLMRMKEFATRLNLPILARSWQMLLKLGSEIDLAPNRLMGAEMAIIRLTHISDQPPPSELLAKLQAGTGTNAQGGTQTRATSKGTEAKLVVNGDAKRDDPLQAFRRFEQVTTLLSENRETAFLMELERTIRLKSFAPGRIEFAMAEGAAADFPSRLSQKLKALTGARWGISVVETADAKTIQETRQKARSEAEKKAENAPIVKYLKQHFPNAKIIDISMPTPKSDEEFVPDDWDAIDIDDIG